MGGGGGVVIACEWIGIEVKIRTMGHSEIQFRRMRPLCVELSLYSNCPVLFPVCLQKQQSVLMSVITGEAVASLRTMDDKQVLQQCMSVLRELFKEQVRKLLERMKVLIVDVI